MNKKGNLPALLKAIPKNPKMSYATKQKAKAKVLVKLHRRKATSRPHKGQGVEGFREATIAGVKLASKPIDTAVEGLHLINGIRKMYIAARKWWDRHA